MNILKNIYIVVLLLISSSFLKAQHEESGDTTKPYKNKLIALPIAFYAPETKLAYGGLGIYLFKAGHDWHTRTSNFDFAIVHTTNNQTIIEPTYTIFTKAEKYYIRGTWIYALKANETWFPLGNINKKGDALDVKFNNFKFNNKIFRQIKPHLYVGLQQQYSKISNLDYNPNEVSNQIINPSHRHLLLRDLEYLKKNKTVSGMGLGMLFDTRDNIVNPFKGNYVDAGFTKFSTFIGSNYSFTNFFFDVRHYKHFKFRDSDKLPFSNATVAFNFIANINTAKFSEIDSLDIINDLSYIENRANRPPVHQLASLGGNIALRGFYRGRFKDINALLFQAEYRQQIYGRFGITAFAGAGEVVSQLDLFSLKSLNYSYGMGLRIMLKKSERLNFRLDFGMGNKDSRGVYAGISEAF